MTQSDKQKVWTVAPIETDQQERTTSANKILVVFMGGCGYVLRWEADYSINEWFTNVVGANEEGCDLDALQGYYEPQPDGLWVMSMKFVDDGPGDWPGSREVAVNFFDPKPATPEEWKAFRAGEWIWDDPSDRNKSHAPNALVGRERSR